MGGVPHLIHQIWVGPRPLPSLFERFAEGWREKHPRWSYVLWTAPPDGFRNASLLAEASRFVPAASMGQFASDLMRYEILHQFGGVYVDTDFECRRSIEELVGDVECFAAWEQQDVWVNNAIMGAVPGAPFLERLIAELPASVHANVGARPNVLSGPQFVTKMYREHPDELTVFDEKWFYPYTLRELDRKDDEFPEAYAIHHWSNARRRRGAPL